jgi:cytosine/adenosine deaminase-related metal-dependent hydrolase
VTSRTLLTGGCVLTLGAKTPNFTKADVLLDDGVVADVGPGLRARDAEQVDATDTIVMPGFVDTHRHAWASLFRNLGELGQDGEAAPASALGDHYEPDDVYAAILIGLLGAVEAGITTVVDWADLELEGFADAALQAHADAGLRSVFVHVAGSRGGGHPDVTTATGGVLARLKEAAGPSTTIALGSRARGTADLDSIAREWALARELGMHIHAHGGSGAPGPAVAGLADRNLLGEDVTLVHCTELDAAEIEAIAGSRTSVSLAPSSEMVGGLGSPPIQQLIDHHIRPGLGVGDERVSPGDMFAQMRATISLQHAVVFDRKLAGKAGLPRLMSTRDVIRFATADGARVAGLAGVTGSLEPGMRADVIVLRTDRPNVFPINDPIGAVGWGMDTSNVDWVFGDGRVLMRDGVLQADVQRARDLATTARRRVAAASGLVAGAAPGGGR